MRDKNFVVKRLKDLMESGKINTDEELNDVLIKIHEEELEDLKDERNDNEKNEKEEVKKKQKRTVMDFEINQMAKLINEEKKFAKMLIL